MKDWDHYKSTLPFHGTREIRAELRKEIDEQKLTASERESALSAINGRANEIYTERNKDRIEDEKRLDAEFWQDCRDDLDYDSWLNDVGVSALEAHAYVKGHSGGHGEVYGVLVDLVSLLESIRGNLK